MCTEADFLLRGRSPNQLKSIIMGLENDFKEIEEVASGQGGNDGDNNANNSDGSNDKTEDTLVDSGECLRTCLLAMGFTKSSSTAVDEFATKEGMPAGFDPEVNNVVNDEINKF